VSVRGTGGTVGFVFLYELMTGTLALRVLNDDSCYNWGCLLLRLLPPKKFQKLQTMTSLLRVLTYNPNLAGVIPKYEDTRKHKISIMFKGQNVIQKLLENGNQFLRSRPAGEVKWPKFDPAQAKASDFVTRLVVKESSYRRARLYALDLRVSDLSLSQRVVDPGSQGFCEKPLGEFAQFVAEKTRSQRGMHEFAPMRIQVEAHPSTRSKVRLAGWAGWAGGLMRARRQAARDVLERLASDIEHFCQDANAATEPEMAVARTHLQDLAARLDALIAQDSARVNADIDACVQGLNSEAAATPRSAAFALRRLCGHEPALWFELIASTLMSEAGDVDLLRLNPYLTADRVRASRDTLVGLMLRTNRIHQAMRAVKVRAPPPPRPLTLLNRAGAQVVPKGHRRERREAGGRGPSPRAQRAQAVHPARHGGGPALPGVRVQLRHPFAQIAGDHRARLYAGHAQGRRRQVPPDDHVGSPAAPLGGRLTSAWPRARMQGRGQDDGGGAVAGIAARGRHDARGAGGARGAARVLARRDARVLQLGADEQARVHVPLRPPDGHLPGAGAQAAAGARRAGGGVLHAHCHQVLLPQARGGGAHPGQRARAQGRGGL
jgi:hypothetical protein